MKKQSSLSKNLKVAAFYLSLGLISSVNAAEKSEVKMIEVGFKPVQEIKDTTSINETIRDSASKNDLVNQLSPDNSLLKSSLYLDEVGKDVSSKQNNLNDIVKQELSKNVFFQKNQEKIEKVFFRMEEKDREFKKLNTKNLFKDKEFMNRFGSYGDMNNILETRKLIYEMQTFTDYISNKYSVDKKVAEEIVYSTYIESHKEEISPILMLSLIGIESSYDPKAKSNMGATGLTQIMPQYHRAKAKRMNVDLNSIQGNIRVGIAVLREYIDLDNGNIRKALQRYNGSYKDLSLKYSKAIFSKMESLLSIREQTHDVFAMLEN